MKRSRYADLKPKDIRKLSSAELRKLYSSARSAANKRISRLKAAGIGKRYTEFPKISNMSNADIRKELADVSKFMGDFRTSVSGEKRFLRDEISELNSRGYDFINQSNIYDFIDFMEKERQEAGEKLYSSGDAVDVFNEGQRLKIPADVLHKHFEYFVENMDKMEAVKPIKTERAISFSDIKRKMSRL